MRRAEAGTDVPGTRPVQVAILAAVVIGVAIAIATALSHDSILQLQQAAKPSESRSNLASALWSRVGAAAAAAVIWPLLLRRLRRGNIGAYMRMRLVSLLAAIALVGVAVSGTAPLWLHLLQFLQALAQLIIFVTLNLPALRHWANTHRAPGERAGAWRPALFLLVAAPFLAEISIGDIPFTKTGLFAAAVALPIYCGALLIRETVRRLGRGWGAILLLGGAYMLVEEGLALQSTFSPTIYSGAGPAWGARWFGVNGVYTEVQLINHIVWSVAVPILIAEIAFPEYRRTPWLRRPIFILLTLLYLVGVGLVLLTARTVLTPHYWAPAWSLIVTGVLVVGLIVGALRVRPSQRSAIDPASRGSSLVATGVTAAIASFVVLAGLVWPGHFGATYPRTALVALPATAALVIVAACGYLVLRAVRRGRWSDRHSIAMCAGLVTGHVLCWGVTQPHGLIGRPLVLGLLVLTLAWLARLFARSQSAMRPPTPSTGSGEIPRWHHVVCSPAHKVTTRT